VALLLGVIFRDDLLHLSPLRSFERWKSGNPQGEKLGHTQNRVHLWELAKSNHRSEPLRYGFFHQVGKALQHM
jgi:hypothetical protein